MSDGKPNLFLRDVNGGEQSMPLLPPSMNGRFASDWSRDGRFLIYTESDLKTGADIWYLPEPGKPGSMPVKFLGTATGESQGMLSPDGRWLAYLSFDSDVFEIVIRSFPSGDRVIRVPAPRAREPRWNKDGSELFYITDGKPRLSVLMSVSVQAGPDGGLRFGTPQRLAEFESRGIVPQSNVFRYSPHPDGKRFLIYVNSEDVTPSLNVITNWRQFASRR
jgi:hypothetical protein